MATAPSGVIVLESSDDERVPTDEEVNEYAEFLGLDPDNEPHLMWIAREGVVAPVPTPWKACTENGDDVFYFNFETGESVWDHPSDETYRSLVHEHRERIASKGPDSPPDAKGDGAALQGDLSPGSEDTRLPASDKGGIAKSRGGMLDLGATESKPQDKDLSSHETGEPVDNDRGRLGAIISEISDEDMSESSQISPRSPTSPEAAANGAASVPGPRHGDHGSAGVGLAPARGLSVNTSLDQKGEGDNHSPGSSQSSPLGASISGAPSQSQSGGALAARRNGSAGSGKSGLDRAGQSGRSSNLSEVSEDFPSDFEQSEVLSPTELGAQRNSFGDSLEVSATMDGDPHSAPAVPTTDTSGSTEATESKPAGEPHVTSMDKSAAGLLPASSRLAKIQEQFASLERCLSHLRSIRGQQQEYLQLLQSGC